MWPVYSAQCLLSAQVKERIDLEVQQWVPMGVVVSVDLAISPELKKKKKKKVNKSKDELEAVVLLVSPQKRGVNVLQGQRARAQWNNL